MGFNNKTVPVSLPPTQFAPLTVGIPLTVHCDSPPPSSYKLSRAEDKVSPSTLFDFCSLRALPNCTLALATMNTILATPVKATFDNHLVDQEYLTSRDHRRSNVTETVHGRHRAARRLEEQRKVLWSAHTNFEVAPKWTRHAEEYINPHLLEHEREPIAPRYGADSVPSRLMPNSERCRCSWCLEPLAAKKATLRRETQAVVKSVVSGSTSARKGQWVDWDWTGENDSFAVEHGDEWGQAVDKPAPVAQVDLLAMAKPAKAKRRTIAHQKRALTYGSFAGPSHRDVDNISMLDYEETWEHLDPDQLDRLLRGLDDNDAASEWDWDKCSQA